MTYAICTHQQKTNVILTSYEEPKRKVKFGLCEKFQWFFLVSNSFEKSAQTLNFSDSIQLFNRSGPGLVSEWEFHLALKTDPGI